MMLFAKYGFSMSISDVTLTQYLKLTGNGSEKNLAGNILRPGPGSRRYNLLRDECYNLPQPVFFIKHDIASNILQILFKSLCHSYNNILVNTSINEKGRKYELWIPIHLI